MPRGPGSRLQMVQLLPNLMTLAALVAGLSSMRMVLLGRVEMAVGLILLAALLDGLDGRVARALKSESALGAELDSFADFLNFGVAPAFVLFLASFDPASGAGWMAMVAYSLCCVLRLARFNIGQRAEADPDAAPKDGFSGVPSPAGALLVMAPVYLSQALDMSLPSWLVAVHAVAVGVMMILPLPTPSFKRLPVPPGAVRLLLLGLTLVGVGVVIWPWATLLAVSLAYLVRVLAGWAVHLRREGM